MGSVVQCMNLHAALLGKIRVKLRRTKTTVKFSLVYYNGYTINEDTKKYIYNETWNVSTVGWRIQVIKT